MNYRELQKALRFHRERGETDFMLNLPKPMLEAELLRLKSAPVSGEVIGADVVKFSQLEDEQVAKTPTETPQSTDAKEIDTVAKINYRMDIELEETIEGKIELFLSAVRQNNLSKEQLQAIEFALTVADSDGITISDALAKWGKFHLFPPNKLLAWGFDQLIAHPELLPRFQRAVVSVCSRAQVNVNVKFSPNPESAALLASWASSWCGSNWCSGIGPDYQDEDWSFPSLEYAEQFREYCEKLDFVQSATIDRIASDEPVPRQKLVELGMVS